MNQTIFQSLKLTFRLKRFKALKGGNLPELGLLAAILTWEI